MSLIARLLLSQMILASLFAFAAPANAATSELLTNGTFVAGLAGWTGGPSTAGSVAGTCGYNGDTAPGTEALTGTAGFTTVGGATTEALGSISLTAIGYRSCVLYQDIAIPVGATTLDISGDFGIKLVGGLASGDTAIFVGLYPATAVPSFQASPAVGGTRLVMSGALNGPALLTQGPTTINVTSVAGTTVRFAIINAIQSTSSGTGAFVPGAGSVVGAGRVSALVTAPGPVAATSVPTLSEWGMILLAGLLGLFGMARAGAGNGVDRS